MILLNRFNNKWLSMKGYNMNTNRGVSERGCGGYSASVPMQLDPLMWGWQITDGRFDTYIRTKQLNDEWFNLSDEWVCQVPLHTITASVSRYICVYDRVERKLSNWIWFNVARIAAHYTLEISQISRTASNYLFVETMRGVPESHSRHHVST